MAAQPAAKNDLHSQLNSLMKEVGSALAAATQETFSKQAGVEVNAGKPYVKKAETKFDTAHCAAIGILGKGCTGAVALCFGEQYFLKLMSKMLREEFTEMNEDVEDGASELLNIIFGIARQRLNQSNSFKIAMAIPTIIKGNGMNIDFITPHPALVLPFSSSLGAFHIQMGIELS